MVHVQQGTLGAFEQDFLVRIDDGFQHAPDRRRIGQDFRRDLEQFGDELVRGIFRLVHAAAQGVVMVQDLGDAGAQGLFIGQVDNADGAAADLVLIRRTDTAAGRADGLAVIAVLAHGVQLAVDRQDQRGCLGNLHDFRGDGDALFGDAVDLGHEGPGIDDDTITDHGELAADHAGGQQGKLVDILADDERMAGIVTALEAGHHIGAVRQPVNQLALAFIAPLSADDWHIGHFSLPF